MLYWLMRSLADVPDDDAWLSADERALAARLRFPKRRADWRLGRWTAKQAAQLLLARRGKTLELSCLEIRAAKDGAPELFLRGDPMNLPISISHSEGMGFCALRTSPTDLGCDLELVQPFEDTFAQDYFAAEETALVKRASANQRDLLLTLIWSAKESVLKALRQGLRRDTRSVLITPVLTAPEGVAWIPFSAQCVETARFFSGWWRAAGGFIQTIAAEGTAKKIPQPL